MLTGRRKEARMNIERAVEGGGLVTSTEEGVRELVEGYMIE